MEKLGDSIDDVRVLVVEDEYYLAVDLVSALRQAGAEVIGPASDEALARNLLAQHAPDCAIVDMNLSGEIGTGLLAALEQAAVPYIILSGYDRTSLPLSGNAAPYVEKPADLAAVVRMIPALLHRSPSA